MADEAGVDQAGTAGAGRVDRWLFFSRLCKSRSLAAQLCHDGRVRIDGVTVRRAAQTVRPGTEIAIEVGRSVRRVRVRALGLRRGPAPEAQGLYEDLGTVPAENGWD